MANRLSIASTLLCFFIVFSSQSVPASTQLIINNTAHQAAVSASVSNPSGTLFFTASEDKTVKVWDTASGQLLKTLYMPFDEGSEGRLYAIALSPDETMIAVAGFTGVIQQTEKTSLGSAKIRYQSFVYLIDWHLETLVKQIGPIAGLGMGLSFSPQGKRLAVVSASRTPTSVAGFEAVKRQAHVYKLANGKRLFSTPPQHNPISFTYLDNGQLLQINTSLNQRLAPGAELIWRKTNFAPLKRTHTDTRPTFNSQAKTPSSLNQKLVDNPHTQLLVHASHITIQSALDGKTFQVNSAILGSAFNHYFDLAARRFSVSTGNSTNTQPSSRRLNGTALAQQRRLNNQATKNRSLNHRACDTWAKKHNNYRKFANPLDGVQIPLEQQTCVILDRQRNRIGLFRATTKAHYWMTGTSTTPLTAIITPKGNQLAVLFVDGSLRLYSVESGAMELGIYVDKASQDWIVWNSAGYYDSSPMGDNLVGWRSNNGSTSLASFRSARQFERDYYAPHKIDQILQTDSAIVRSVQPPPAELKRPPQIRLLSPRPGSALSQADIKVEFEILSEHSELESFNLFVNSIPVLAYADRNLEPRERQRLVRSFTLPLFSSHNRIRIEATNADGMDVEETLLNTMARTPQHKGKLFVLAIGINQFPQLPNDYQLNFAAQDARAVVNYFSEQGDHSTAKQGLFSSVETLELSDLSALKPSKESILKALEFTKQVGSNDTLLLFIASHGANDQRGNYYMFPRGSSLPDVDSLSTHTPTTSSLIGWQDIYQAINNAAGRRLLIVDTCQSAAIKGTFDLHSLAKKSAQYSYGLLAAAKADQDSQELPAIGHGLFTYSLLTNLGPQSDTNGDGSVTVSELFPKLVQTVQSIATEIPQDPQIEGSDQALATVLYQLTASELRAVNRPEKELN